MDDSAAAAREAFRRHAWSKAVTAYREADRQRPLPADDLLSLAAAAWWSGETDEAVDTLERAYAAYVDEGRPDQAAVVALRLAELAMTRLAFSIAGGWIARADRLLADRPETVSHAWLAFVHGLVALLQRGDVDAGADLADRSLDLARRHGSPDVESLALSLKGQILLRTGRWAEGLALVDEAAAAAASDRLDPKNACDVYCFTISACSDVGAYRRAGEWIDKADQWMQRRSLSGYQGVCRVHRAELKRLRGAWIEAEQEARDACLELERFRLLDAVGYALYEVGEIRLRLGDLAAAEESFQKAYEYGRDPQPGLALLMLARGEVEEAARSIAASLSTEEGGLLARDQLMRTRLLAAQVEIALARGDVATAEAASQELTSIAGVYDSETLHAAALTANGALRLSAGSLQEAIGTLNRAWRLWQHIDIPYESARARLLLGRARGAAGDPVTARRELRAARSTFERLGAAPDLRLVDALLREGAEADEDRRHVDKTFMFTDIVASTELLRLIGDTDWKRLIAWHDKTLRSAFGDHGGEEVRHTGDGFFVTFERAADAVKCAIDIQRTLSEHRREHGFALRVRIGLHAAEAVQHGADYAGHGVHVAARVGAIAEAEEIVATRPVVEGAGDVGASLSGPRTVALKGIAEPVDVWTVRWA